ncbi:hypothetical protein NADFUDRAFT_68374 [Nadsonia fulvescens var. elongata DSM 6958]|uniref:RRM domain-containing protein n=1 Tax=Nadsonia fulvescens var. elongata DSM 6958 TaxID=857566 RepID=A0A1E3PRK6_9ASCO|nr:hypothetical protein NADFUDRAFT_68374 [Nadsonia fulvescens var. elongata DSM 6958]
MSNQELTSSSLSETSEVPHPVENSLEKQPIDSPLEVENDGRRLFIGSLDKNATEDDLKELFSDFKDVKIELSKPRFPKDSKRPPFVNRGFAFAEFETKEDANRAMETKDKSDVGIKSIYIKLASVANSKDQEEKPESHKKKSSKKQKAKKPLKDNSNPEINADSEKSVSGEAPVTTSKSKKSRREADYSLAPYNLYIKNVGSSITPKALLELFSEFKPTWARVNKSIIYSKKEEKEVNKHLGTAFVGFLDKESRDGCVEKFNETELEGESLEISPSGRAQFKYFEVAQAES